MKRKIVHIGLMKSGTTYIQNSLHQNREFLRSQNVVYPGNHFNQQHACYGICGSRIPWVTPNEKWNSLGDKLLKDISLSKGTTIVSSEALSSMDRESVKYFIEKIDGIDEVIITLRDLYRTLISAWQQSIKTGGTNSLSDFFARLSKDKEKLSGLWKSYAFGEIASIWSEFSNVNVVILPLERDERDFLKDIINIIGVEDLPDKNIGGSAKSNVSLKYEDVELLRLFNINNQNEKAQTRNSYNRWLLNKVMFPVADEALGSKIKLPEEHIPLIKKWTHQELGKLRKIPASLYGTYDDLLHSRGVTIGQNEIDEHHLLRRINSDLLSWHKRIKSQE